MSTTTRALEQKIRFCAAADGTRIAYATVGNGPPLVKAANWLSHLEFDWNSPVWRHWMGELSRHHTLVRYDERGCGLSDWTVEDFSLDAWVQDLEAVVDALGLERFPVLGISQGGPIAIAYAVRNPGRVSHLILYGSYSRGRSHRNLSKREREERDVMLRMIGVGWGTDHPAFRQVFTTLFIPDANPEQVAWFNELQRVSATPENAARIVAAFDKLDVRELATRVDVPTLVLQGTGDLRVPFAEGRLLASLIPGARFVPLESRNHLLLADEPAWPRFLREVREFLGMPAEAEPFDAARRRQIESLFDQVMDLAPAARQEILATACRDDPELRREVEALLELAGQSGLTTRLGRALTPGLKRRPGAAIAPGTSLANYEITERIGGGGMGVIYRAYDPRLQRQLALKFLPSSVSADPKVKRRFLQEAKAIAALDHPNLCTIFAVEETDDGQLCIVMPYYPGETLREKIQRGPLPIAHAVHYGTQIAAGLAHAHAAGVVHRDIKPANLIVTGVGRVKILDFGIAKVADANLTRTGAVLGTLSYMSPEQAAGEAVDHRTDLWALGVVLYEMLSGGLPFRAESREGLFYAIQCAQPVAIAVARPEVPPLLGEVVGRLLEKEAVKRYLTTDAVLASLEQCPREPFEDTPPPA